MRDLGVTSAAVGLVPEPLVGVLAGLTFLGSPTFLAVATPASAWLGYRIGHLTRRDAMRFVAVVALGIGISSLVKSAIALPRPPRSMWLVVEEGFGFPSGHALVTTSVTVGYVRLARIRSPRTGYLLAMGFSTVIAATRVLLGVHYLLDVVVGIGLGVAIVVAGRYLTERTLSGSVGLAIGAWLLGVLLAW